tara:strand:+ start:78 stop:179 length:102 start_codon:yes stop_codon:yes gene_type:complete
MTDNIDIYRAANILGELHCEKSALERPVQVSIE